MIIGNKHSFAIQFDVNPKPDRWLFGHICFVVNCTEIGDYDDETSLSTVVGYLMDLLWYKGLREEPKLFQLEKTALFGKLDKALYNDPDASLEECQENWERFAKFHALSEGDIFDHWKGYLIEHEDQGRLIIKNPREEIQEYFLKVGELDSVLENVVNFFEQNYSQYFIHWSKQQA
jgi:hypothetical protein